MLLLIAHDLIETKTELNKECKESIEKQLAGTNEDDMIVTPKDIDKVVTDRPCKNYCRRDKSCSA